MNYREKIVQIYPSAYKLHTAYRSLLSCPPEGYKIIGHSENYKRKLIDFLRNYKLVKRIYHLFVNMFKSKAFYDSLIGKPKDMQEADLIFSTGELYFGNKPWILDVLDNPSSISGYNNYILAKNKAEIEKCLLSKNCKKILCSHQTSLDAIKNNFSKDIVKKSAVVMNSITPGKVARNKVKKDKIRILFVGSINNPQDFYGKGGLEAIKSFEKISKENNAELIIRCKVPIEIKNMIKNIKNIVVIEKEISEEELVRLYSSSDIFLLPGHHFHLMAVLEAMSYGLPIIVLDTYAFKDYIKDKYNGFLVKKSDKIGGYFEKNYPNNVRTERFIEEIREVDSEVINRLAEKLNLLIKNKKLREKMGKNGLKLVKTKFSIKRRNMQLKKIFDEALKYS